MDTWKPIDDETYQILTRQAIHDEKWAAYFFLFNACYQIMRQTPTTREECEQTDIEVLLVETLEHLGKAVEEILPGGAAEFDEYMPLSRERYRRRNKRFSKEKA